MDGQKPTSDEHVERARILVVEDNPLMLSTIESLLVAQNYEVSTSINGEEALITLDNGNFDLIICDVMMPRMDGYTLYKRLREEPQYAHIPFIFLTALDDRHDIDKGKSIGADDYVTKPFEPRTLLAVVEGKVVRAKHIKSSANVKMNEFRSRIVQTLSHEFRTPLVAISTGTELLLDHLATIKTEQAQTVLAAIKRGGDRLERLVNDFMVVQQIEGGVAARLFDTRAKVVPVADILSDIKLALSQLGSADSARVCVCPQVLSSSCGVKVFPPQVVEIVMRLLNNALKFSGDEEVLVSFAQCDSEFRIAVRDFGEGFDLARLPEALALFGQLDRAQYEQQGGGFGLTIASRLAEICSGRLDFVHLDCSHVGFSRNDTNPGSSIIFAERKPPEGKHIPVPVNFSEAAPLRKNSTGAGIEAASGKEANSAPRRAFEVALVLPVVPVLG